MGLSCLSTAAALPLSHASELCPQVEAVRGKASWSGPFGWAYLDMMMTGGQGCKDQCVGPESDQGHCNWTKPEHCPGMSEEEYRTEASLYVVVSSPLMVGTDIRLMTPIMKVRRRGGVWSTR